MQAGVLREIESINSLLALPFVFLFLDFMLLGLTGQIGAGKSTGARILESFGAYVIDADMIGKQVVENSPALLNRLVKQFGKEILSPSGKPNRKTLAMRAFSSAENKAALDALVHPYLLKELHSQVKQAKRKYKVVIIDAALLLDWDLDKAVDATIVITASQRLRVDRMTTRGFNPKDTLARQRAQLPLCSYRERATHIVANNGSEEQLRRKLTRLWKQLLAESN